MPNNGFVQQGLRIIRLYGSPQAYQLIAKIVRRDNLSKSQERQLHILGKQVGLSQSEVLSALDKPSNNGNGGIPVWLRWFVILGGILAAVIIGAAWLNYVRYTTYIPGTLYGAISPRDFE